MDDFSKWPRRLGRKNWLRDGGGVIFSAEARVGIRAIERDTALWPLKALDRFLETEPGDVKQLQGFDPPQYRFCIGVWRVI